MVAQSLRVALNYWIGAFRTPVSQDSKRRVSACFVANDNVGQIAGYYTLASASILLSDLPETLAKKLPRYPTQRAGSVHGASGHERFFQGHGHDFR